MHQHNFILEKIISRFSLEHLLTPKLNTDAYSKLQYSINFSGIRITVRKQAKPVQQGQNRDQYLMLAVLKTLKGAS